MHCIPGILRLPFFFSKFPRKDRRMMPQDTDEPAVQGPCGRAGRGYRGGPWRGPPERPKKGSKRGQKGPKRPPGPSPGNFGLVRIPGKMGSLSGEISTLFWKVNRITLLLKFPQGRFPGFRVVFGAVFEPGSGAPWGCFGGCFWTPQNGGISRGGPEKGGFLGGVENRGVFGATPAPLFTGDLTKISSPTDMLVD